MKNTQINKPFIIIFAVMILYVLASGYIFARFFEDIYFAVSNRSLMTAVKMVKEQERELLKKQVQEMEKDSVKRILTPLVEREINN